MVTVIYTILSLTVLVIMLIAYDYWRNKESIACIKAVLYSLKYAMPQHTVGWDVSKYKAYWEHGCGSFAMLHDRIIISIDPWPRAMTFDLHQTSPVMRYFVGRMRQAFNDKYQHDEQEFEHIRLKYQEYVDLRQFYDNDRSRKKVKIEKHH